MLHGFGSTGAYDDTYFHLGEEAMQRGFVYAYPDGTKDGTGSRFWNATDACCDLDGSGVADVEYLDALITEIESSTAIDPKRIDVIGHSNGGFMSYRLACDHADRIAALISLAGATFSDPADCDPIAPVSVVQVHGTADDTILFEGGKLSGARHLADASYPGALQTATTWATYDGCRPKAVATDERVDVDTDLSADGLPAEASVSRWAGCQGNAVVELWTIPGGSHSPTISDAFADAALDFFEAHPKP